MDKHNTTKNTETSQAYIGNTEGPQCRDMGKDLRKKSIFKSVTMILSTVSKFLTREP